MDFEQPIAELEAQIEELKNVGERGELDINIEEELQRLKQKSKELTEKIFSELGAWQVAQLARHPLRPYTLDYIKRIFTEFDDDHAARFKFSYIEKKHGYYISHGDKYLNISRDKQLIGSKNSRVLISFRDL